MTGFIRRRLVAWLMPEIDRALRVRHQAENRDAVARGALSAGRAAVKEMARP